MGRTLVPILLLVLPGLVGLALADADDDPAMANWITNYQTITGSLHGTTDPDDWYRINLTLGDVIEVHLTVPGGADFDLGIMNSTRADWLDTSLGIDDS